MKYALLTVILTSTLLNGCTAEPEPTPKEKDTHFLSGQQKAIEQAKAMSGTLEEAARKRNEEYKKQIGR